MRSPSQPHRIRKRYRATDDGSQHNFTGQARSRTHAFTGCLTCRQRHVKCDLGQPLCNCHRLKIPCEGYMRKYSWLPPKILGGKDSSKYNRRKLGLGDSSRDVDESQSSRRVLFSGNLHLAPIFMKVNPRDRSRARGHGRPNEYGVFLSIPYLRVSYWNLALYFSLLCTLFDNTSQLLKLLLTPRIFEEPKLMLPIIAVSTKFFES